jgi:hypothetical protein
MHSAPEALRTVLVAALSHQHSAFRRLLAVASIGHVREWEDGSLWIELNYETHTERLAHEERWALTGTHPGLPFTIQVQREAQPRLGMVYFDEDGTQPRRIELNVVIESAPFNFEAAVLETTITAAGEDPEHPAHRRLFSGDA